MAGPTKKSAEDHVKETFIEELVKKKKAASVPAESKAVPETLFTSNTKEPEIKEPYSKHFTSLPARCKDFDVSSILFKDEDWDEDDRAFIPDAEKFTDHYRDPAVMYPLVLGLVYNMNTLIHGPTGCGKSTGVECIASICRWPFLRVNGREDMESDALIGKPWVNHGNMEWMMGSLPIARRKGWLVLMDEPFKMPAGIQMTLQRMYERGGILQIDDMPGTLKDKQIIPHKNTRLILADNVAGTGDNLDKYAATQIQDTSTLNRMELVVEVDYLPNDAEQSMLTNKYPHLPDQWARRMVQLASLVRNGFKKGELSSTMSTRQLYTWAELSVVVGSYRRSFDIIMRGRFAEDSEVVALDNLYTMAFGKE